MSSLENLANGHARNVVIKIVQELLSANTAQGLAKIVGKLNVVGETVITLKSPVEKVGTFTTRH